MKKDDVNMPDYKGASYDEIRVKLGTFQCIKKHCVSALLCTLALTLFWFVAVTILKSFLEESLSFERMIQFSVLTTTLSVMVFYTHTTCRRHLFNFHLVRLFSKQSPQKQKPRTSENSGRKP